MRIKDIIDEYVKNNPSRFHTPGHGGISTDFAGDIGDVFPFDVTELPELGSLYETGTPIQNSEQLMADLYGADGCIFSAGGATLSIQTMLLTAVGYGGSVIVSRNVHISVINTLTLLHITPVWFYPTDNGTPVGYYDPKVLTKLIKENKNIDAVLINTPDYYGFISDVESLSRVTKKHGLKLLVDNAHGSHLKFCSELHPISCGADLCVDSFHKTLPVLTGGAGLFFKGAVSIAQLKKNASLFGSTSPSFLVLYSIDRCIDYLKQNGRKDFSNTAEKVSALKTKLKKHIPCNFPSDPCRITLCFGGADETFIKNYFINKKIYYEFVSGDTAVFIITPFTSNSDLDKLKNAVLNFPSGARTETYGSSNLLPEPEQAMAIWEAAFADSETVLLEDSLGRICGADYSVYPPGTPIIMPGEIIDKFIVNILKSGGTSHVKVVKLK